MDNYQFMKSFVVLLRDKNPAELTNELLLAHVNHLKILKQAKKLVLAGPFTDGNQAIIIINAESEADAKNIVRLDPFIQERYYKHFQIFEFQPASEENNWLMPPASTSP